MLHGGEIYGRKIEHDFSVNLNPMGCPDKVRHEAERSLHFMDCYPDIFQEEFRNSISQMESVDKSMVIGGNGSSELFHAIVSMVRPRKALLVQPGFYGYEHALMSINNCDICTYELNADNDFVLDNGFVERINSDIDLVIIANPNNPTGKTVTDDVMDEIVKKCKSCDVWLVVDECFLKLSDGKSVIKSVESNSKLIVVSAFTKLMAIPGIRCGYVISNRNNIEILGRFLPEWNMSITAQMAGKACAEEIKNTDFVEKSLEEINMQKNILKIELEKLGVKVIGSDTCFLLCKSDFKIFEPLLDKGILVRSCKNFKCLDESYFRIAVKTQKENEILLERIRKIIEDL